MMKHNTRDNQDSPEIVNREVRALLSELTPGNFDLISDQIVVWANKSESETGGRTLIKVIRLVFEKATDEASWTGMYARLCRKMMDQLSPNVQDESIRDAEGRPITGGLLFRRYLLNRCREDFERVWAAKISTAAAAKASEDRAEKEASEKDNHESNTDEVQLHSDYAAQRAKRQGLCLVTFIGELYKLQMVAERMMRECIKKLLNNVDNPEEEELESLCTLLMTVGQALDTPKARGHMDVYFSRMKELAKSGNVSLRMQFMLRDVIELRERKWQSHSQVTAPQTIQQLHEAASEERMQQEREALSRSSMSRGGSRRDHDRDAQQVGQDGWAVASGTAQPGRKAGDLSHFGKISKFATGPMQFGPTSVFSNKKDSGKRESSQLSRPTPSQNMFSMLEGNVETPVPPPSRGSRSPSRTASVDLGTPAESGQRPRLNLLPRPKSVAEQGSTAVGDEEAEEVEITESGGAKKRSKRVKAHDKINCMYIAAAAASEMVEPVAPLKVSANRWRVRRNTQGDQDTPEVVDRKVRALLNKLTMERFDSISDQIIVWANKSEKETDGRTLIQVIRLVFEKATDEATWSEMYARLCRKMMEQISPNVQDEGIRNAEGRPITGGLLFRKYLLNRCQDDFERGWAAKDSTAAAAKAKASEDQAVKEANEKGKEKGTEEVQLYSDEYYAAQKAKRQGLGLVTFIGELYKLQMLTERIMHECIKKLLSNVDNPEEEELESLCKLLTTVGQALDTPKARGHMDVYFSRMKELAKSGNVSLRMQFMLRDAIELRERNWQSRTQVTAPLTIQQLHDAASKERMQQEREALSRSSMSRGGLLRGCDQFTMELTPEKAEGVIVAKNEEAKLRELAEGVAAKGASVPKEQEEITYNDIDEFFVFRDLDKAEGCFVTLPADFHAFLIERLVLRAIDSNKTDAQLVADCLGRVKNKRRCSAESLEEGFSHVAGLLNDIALDAPNAFELMDIMMIGAGFDEDTLLRITQKVSIG